LVVLEDGVVTILHIIRGKAVTLFATHNSFQLKVAVSPFLQIRGDINFSSYLAEDQIHVKFDFCLTVHHQLGKVIQINQLDATMIY